MEAVGREMDFFCLNSTLPTVHGKTFLTKLIRIDGKRRIGEGGERGGGRNGGSLFSGAASAAKSLIAVQLEDMTATSISQCG